MSRSVDNPTMTERSGDATITTLLTLPHRPDDPQPTVAVYAHDDGGVTLLARDQQGTELARISVVREVWDAVVASRIEEERDRYRAALRSVADVLDRGTADSRKLATITRLVHGALDDAS